MDCCPYCEELEKGFLEYQDKNYGNRILFETENFIVFPTLGQIVEGYLLIASKKHYVSVGEIPKEQYYELEEVCKKVKEVLSENYSAPLFFEHGSISKIKEGGCCITHAHLHAVPVQIELLPELSKNFQYKEINSLEEIKEQFQKKIPYFFYQSNSEEKYLFEVPEIVPSQYIRQIIATKIEKPKIWNWKTNPEIEKLLRTIQKLKGKF